MQLQTSIFPAWIITMTVLLNVATVTAQDKVPSPDKTGTNISNVAFYLHSSVNSGTDLFPDIPTDILDELVQYDALDDVSINKDNENNYLLTAEFRFSRLEAFKKWYYSDEVRELLTGLEDENPEIYRINIEIRR